MSSADDANLGWNSLLRLRLNALKMSAVDLTHAIAAADKRAAKSAEQVRRYITGVTVPKLYTRKIIAKIVCVHADTLWPEMAPPYAHKPRIHGRLTPVTDTLHEAIDTIDKRAKVHGDFATLHDRIAALWSAYLQTWVDPHQVAAMMSLLKLARSEQNPANNDNFVDMVGYQAIYAALLKINPSTGPVTPSTEATGAIVSETREKLSEAYVFP